ncbi:MAG: SCP2 sterol-binding domain-containing protein [Deltaproteobacteria bacterium]|nr:SCP2 sterol-binding domain-containing protein [Deltaproteobacteria bacterium]
MALSLEKVLFITSFIPVAAFKTIARVGQATWGQARAAVLIGFILALIQYLAARRILKTNTYLEKAFLGFLLVGTVWVYLLPAEPAHLFVDYSVSILYLTLFLMTFLPQLLGFDPFTYAMAKQWYPPPVWGTDDFRLINFRITYLWSGVFGACFLSSTWGQGKPLYAIIIPFALCIGIGLVFSKKYPDYYLKRKYRVSPEAAAAVPDSAVKLIEGRIPDPSLTIESSGEVWVKMARGEIDRPKALLQGLYKVQGDFSLLSRMPQLFGAGRKSGSKPEFPKLYHTKIDF